MNKLSISLLLLIIISVQLRAQIKISKPANSRGIVYLNQDNLANEIISQPQTVPFLNLKATILDKSTPTRSNDVVFSLEKKELLQSDNYLAFKIDKKSKKISVANSLYVFGSDVEKALKKAPEWLYDDLYRAFMRLNRYKIDDDYARLINQSSSNIADEVAFQVANLSLQTLYDSRFRTTKELLIENAEYIYSLADSLKYVRLIEEGNVSSGDYYTTTEYRIKDGSDTIWVKIPKEIYYWYVIMPKLDREGVYKKDKSNSSQFRTYGYFWKEYLWFNPDTLYDYTQVNITTSKGSIDTIQRFGAIMQQPEILWDRNQKYFPFKRSFDKEDHALDVLGNWASRSLPIDAEGNRPFEPQQIINEHNGNCHEDALLVAAACRTALIPIIHMSVHGEDHAYGMFYDEDWYHYEFFRGGFSKTINSSFAGITNMLKKGSYSWTTSIAFGSRPDGFPIYMSEYYTDKMCTLKIQVLDIENKPVDGARVEFWCNPGPYGSGWKDDVAYAWTDNFGIVEVHVGAGKKYGYQVYHKDFGYIPEANKANVLTLSNSQNGVTYEAAVKFSKKEMPSLLLANNKALPNEASYGINLQYEAKTILAGQNIEDVQKSVFAYRTPDKGSTSFFICNEANYQKFISGQNFDAYFYNQYVIKGNVNLPLPDTDDIWYAIISNQESVTNHQEIDAKIDLITDAKISSTPMAQSIDVFIHPNPVTNYCKIGSNQKINIVEIYNLNGKLVKQLNQKPFIWEPDRNLSRGIYLIKTSTLTDTKIKKVILE